jgi:hypothetical protein
MRSGSCCDWDYVEGPRKRSGTQQELVRAERRNPSLSFRHARTKVEQSVKDLLGNPVISPDDSLCHTLYFEFDFCVDDDGSLFYSLNFRA